MDQERVKTPFPTSLDEEPPIFQQWGIALSLRQLLLFLFGVAIWGTLMKVTASVFSLNMVFTAVFWGWIPVLAAVVALVKKDGRPLEFYITDRLLYLTADREFIHKDPDADQREGVIDEAIWQDDDDDDNYRFNF
jgi:hypothetical protein